MKKLTTVARVCAMSLLVIVIVSAYTLTAEAAPNTSGTMYSTFQNFFLPPGIQKKLTRTGSLPPGIDLKVFLTGATTTPPSPGPVRDIYGLNLYNITDSSADIFWSTAFLGTSKVYYATSSPTVSGVGVNIVANDTTAYFHYLHLSQLASSTKYFYFVVSADSSGHTATSAVNYFTTLQRVQVAPVILSVSALSAGSTTEVVTWQTNVPSSGAVWYSTSTPLDLSKAQVASSTGQVTEHSFTLPNLVPHTFYSYATVSTNASGTATSSTHYFYTGY